MLAPVIKFRQCQGFTLMELVTGIIVMSISLTVVTALIAPQARNSVDPIWQVRATELAQSMLNEISGKAFDENSDMQGGVTRCGDSGADTCTAPASLGPDGGESSRDAYDDIDDYHGITFSSGSDFQDSLGNTVAVDGQNLYGGFQLSVSVFYDGNHDGSDDGAIANSKAIQVDVTTPADDVVSFTLYRSNY